MEKELITFRDEIDRDKGLQSKRAAIITTSSILVVMYWTGAQLKEFTGLIATIEITNAESFKYLLVLATIYQLIRYYGYAHKYHKKLRAFWIRKFLEDPEVFKFDYDNEEVEGLIGRAVNIYVPDCPGIVSPEYENSRSLKMPIWGRKIVYEEKASSQIGEDEYENYTYDEVVPLNIWNEMRIPVIPDTGSGLTGRLISLAFL